MSNVFTEEWYQERKQRVRGGVVAPGLRVGRVSNSATNRRDTASKRALKDGGSQVRNLAPSPYKSQWEEQYAYELAIEKRAGIIKGWAYEDMTFKLAKRKYHRPDFLIWHNDGTIEIAQVKGRHKNLRASMTALTWAAQQRPWFRFTIKRREGRGWKSHDVKV